MQWSGHVSEPIVTRLLDYVARNNKYGRTIITHEDISNYFPQAGSNISDLNAPDELSLSSTASATMFNPKDQPARRQAQLGSRSYVKPQNFAEMSGARLAPLLRKLMHPIVVSLDDPAPIAGQQCDPDNLPDDLPEGMVCQLTGQTEWRFVPGRVLNAKKGDVLLNPGGTSLVAQLMRHVTPAQIYSHSGIMTKNHVEIRHSTGSPEWLLDHPAGSFLGNKGTDGLMPSALKYLWPGTVTQTIDNCYYGEWITSPDTGSYKIAGFAFDPNLSDASSILYPQVVKPNPFDETSGVRLTLHAIADTALAINSHYRFYCYTKPEIALGPEGLAGADQGWAKGTVGTQCASFIWLAAQHANVRLEGADQFTTVGDLEPADVYPGGAQVGAATLDGLYLYTAQERLACGKWLYQYIYDTAYNKSGFLGTLFTDAPDDVANQFCNTFASDWSGDGSKDLDAWKATQDANAVSPDNIIFWDFPGSGNEDQFRSVYGHNEELFYLPGTYTQVPIYRWNQVPTKGTLTGTVTANAAVTGANVSLLGSGMQDVVVGSDGHFEFGQVPSGDYTVNAGLNIGGYWNSASVPVHIEAGKTTDVPVPLQAPPEIHRRVTVSVDSMVTEWTSFWAHAPHGFWGSTSVLVHPFHSHEHIDLGGGDTPRGQIGFDIDLNVDLSVTVSWSAQEIDDEVEGTVTGGTNVAKDSAVSWGGLTVKNDDPIDNDYTQMSFTIYNDQASA